MQEVPQTSDDSKFAACSSATGSPICDCLLSPMSTKYITWIFLLLVTVNINKQIPLNLNHNLNYYRRLEEGIVSSETIGKCIKFEKHFNCIYYM